MVIRGTEITCMEKRKKITKYRQANFFSLQNLGALFNTLMSQMVCCSTTCLSLF